MRRRTRAPRVRSTRSRPWLAVRGRWLGREIGPLLALLMVVVAAGTGCHGPSEDTGVFSANEAVARVSENPEVGVWVAVVKGQSPQNQAVIEVDSDDGAVYTVHAYEIVDDGGGQSHTATFGWYEVSKKKGTVTRTMPRCRSILDRSQCVTQVDRVGPPA